MYYLPNMPLKCSTYANGSETVKEKNTVFKAIYMDFVCFLTRNHIYEHLKSVFCTKNIESNLTKTVCVYILRRIQKKKKSLKS